MVPQSRLRRAQAQPPWPMRADHRRGHNPTRSVDSSRPQQRPRRVPDPHPMTMRDRLHGIQPTLCVPRTITLFPWFATLTFGRSLVEVQAGHKIPPPLPYPPPSHLLYSHLVSQRARALQLIHRVMIKGRTAHLTVEPSRQRSKANRLIRIPQRAGMAPPLT
jgi:hypothetical protein